MKHIIWILLLCPASLAVTCPTDQAKSEAALMEIEKSWARALDEHDIDKLRCILADEFEDVDVNGKVNDRIAVLANAGRSHAVRHELSDLHAHVHGEFAYIRGVAYATDSHAKVTTVRFTDVYVFREKRWQCVAGHESLVSKTSK